MNILKQLVAWAIALRDRFFNDIYFSTRVKIGICLGVFTMIIIGAFLMIVSYLKDVLMTNIIEALLAALSAGKVNPNLFVDSSSQTDAALYFTICALVILASLCGIIVSRLALAPINQAFQIQKRFISGIAHELRTPLSILRMNNEIARMEMDPSVHGVTLLDENISDIDMISEILNNLLLFDRIVSTETLKSEQVSLSDIAKITAGRLSSLASKKEIAIHVAETDIPLVYGSKTALEQVFFNILKNAVSYTPNGGSVEVSYVEHTDFVVRLRITDTGIGIHEKDIPHIFEPFYRSDKTGKLSGTGIGLAIVYEIMKLHNGTIEVESIEGKGTSFFLTFPFYGATHTSSRFPVSLFSARGSRKTKDARR